MTPARKRKSSRSGTQPTKTYSSILGDPLHLVDRTNSAAKENRQNYRYVLSGGRRSSDVDKAETYYLWESLSPREQDVTVLVCRGYTNQQIARSLNITVASVKTYLRYVFLTMQVRNRVELRLKFYNFNFNHTLPHI